MIETAEDLRELATRNVGDVTHSKVDERDENGNYRYDMSYAKEYLEKHTTTEYFTPSSIAQDLRLRELAEIILEDAYIARVSDIQIVQFSSVGYVRFRKDRKMYVDRLIHPLAVEGLCTVLRDFSKVDVNRSTEADITGSISRVYGNNEVVYRCAFSPTIRSQVATLRLLDSNTLDKKLEDLGMQPGYVSVIQQKLSARNGLIILSGGKGEGKSTTAYAMLDYLIEKGQGDLNIMTLENPVEYRVDGIVQSNINELVGYDYDNGVTVKYREAPDVLLLGEINNAKTAKAAVNMATGGNLTISTIHANNTYEIPRALYNRSNLEVDMDMIGSALLLLIHQSLIPKLCPKCKIKTVVSDEERDWIQKNLLTEEIEVTKYKEGTQECSYCKNKRYKGMVLSVELLNASSNIFRESLFTKGDSPYELKEALLKDEGGNFYPLENDVLRHFRNGDITIEQARELVN